MRSLIAALLCILVGVQAGGQYGVSSKVASVAPFPESVAVDGHEAVMCGPAQFGTAGTPASYCTVVDLRTQKVVETITIQGEDTTQEHAASGNAFDGDGNLYVGTTQLGVVRITFQNNKPHQQSIYAPPLPIMPDCIVAGPTPCRPVLPGSPPGSIINDMFFDENGNLYISDSFQATIFVVPRGGGPAQVWFQDVRLAANPMGVPLGPNGLRLSQDRTKVFILVTSNAAFEGTVESIPFVPYPGHPNAADLTRVFTYAPFLGPDGLAISKSGNLYVTLALANTISIITPGGQSLGLLQGPTSDGLAWDGPAMLAFDDAKKTLLFSNHASISGNVANNALIAVYVNDKSDPLERPSLQ